MKKGHARRYVGGLCALTAMTSAALTLGPSAGGSASSGSKAPIVIVDITTLSSAGGLDVFPQGPAGAKAAANAIDAQGGVGGRPIQIVVCNDEGTPDQAAVCGREAVSDHAVGVTADSLFSTSYIAELSAAHIPMVGQLVIDAADFASPYSFPIGASVLSTAPGGAVGLIKDGDKKVGIARLAAEQGDITDRLIIAAIKDHGGTLTTTIQVPATVTTYSVYAEDLEKSGATGVVLNETEAAIVGIIEASVEIGYHPRWTLSVTTFTPAQIKQLGPYIEGSVEPSALPLTSANLPGMKTFRSQMKAELKRGDSAAATLDSTSLGGWLAVYAIADSLKGVKGTISSSVVLSKLRAVHSLSLFGLVDWSPNVSGPSTEPRVSTGTVYLNVIHNGVATYTGETVNLYSK